MNNKVTCFLPCRQGSQRVPRKNIKPFSGFPNGLIEVKLKQLLSCDSIDEVVLSTNDDEILEFASSLSGGKLRLHRRSEHLSTGETSTDELVAHALELIPEGHILWTHVTSPFVTASHYSAVVQRYFSVLVDGYDSLMTTTSLHGFLWVDGKPINYDRSVEKWPRTQTLPPVHEINSAVFLAPAHVYREVEDRVGHQPFLYKLDKLVSHDIDWPEDFVIAECIANNKLVNI